MTLNPEDRWALTQAIIYHFRESIIGSKVELRGSLAAGNNDIYSDIDLLWEVPDEKIETAVSNLKEMLSRVKSLESLRVDPDLKLSTKHRLIYARFTGVPLFWRLDLEIFAVSIKRDRAYDLDNPAANDFEGWSYSESALMNAVGAIKAMLRGNESEADHLLRRAFERIGLPQPDLKLKDQILLLVQTIKTVDTEMTHLGTQIENLVRQLLLIYGLIFF